jgi:hypothetical protein
MKTTLHTNMTTMKQILCVAAIASVMVACKHDQQANQAQPTVTNDTTGLAQFQAWKAQNELNNTAQYTQPQPQTQVVTTQPTTVTKTKVVRVYEPVRRTHYTTMNSSSSNTAKVVHKKGWSKAAKGGVIGGVTGGVIGAVLDKHNRVAGGVIGAVIGGGGGYLIGRHKDKKDGRY